jgi:hypothetical protein
MYASADSLRLCANTVELSDPLYCRLRARAAERVRGCPSIIEEALREYLERDADGTPSEDAFAAARGVWSAAGVCLDPDLPLVTRNVRHFQGVLVCA